MKLPEEKTCARCGRRITYRKKWAKSWANVRYCGAGCRSARLTGADRELEDAIRALLASCPARGTVDPTDAARAVGSDDWKALIEPARQAARRLVAQGQVEITQQGHVVDPSTAKGPFRIRRA